MASRNEIREVNIQLSGLRNEAVALRGAGSFVPELPTFLGEHSTDQEIADCKGKIGLLNSYFSTLSS